MRIQVTRKHINEGRAMSRSCCPVALALKEAGFKDVDVDSADIGFARPYGAYVHVPTPSDAARFIVRFDGHGTVEPFSFDLDVTP